MIALIQRVTRASVTVDDVCIAAINAGILVFLGVEKGDNQHCAGKIVHKILNYRIFADNEGKMNLSLLAVNAQLLVVPQFTLAANTTKGLRPGFSTAASPELGLERFTQVVDIMRQQGKRLLPENWLQTGQFGADMAVELVNDGPVTFLLKI